MHSGQSHKDVLGKRGDLLTGQEPPQHHLRRIGGEQISAPLSLNHRIPVYEGEVENPFPPPFSARHLAHIPFAHRVPQKYRRGFVTIGAENIKPREREE